MLVFIEGISGAGKSTLIRRLTSRLRGCGFTVREHLEFDFLNPIDFYSTAYFSEADYDEFLGKNRESGAIIRENTVIADGVRLVRYFDGNRPLFGEPLLGELRRREFCWNPTRAVEFGEYCRVMRSVWSRYAEQISQNGSEDFVIFDGALLHHPINDMLRNYSVDAESALSQVRGLLETLGELRYRIFYLNVEDVLAQLSRARINRGRHLPTDGELAFWTRRREYDRFVLDRLGAPTVIFENSIDRWDEIEQSAIESLTAERFTR